MVARPFKAGTTIPTIDCVAERHLIRDRRQSTMKSFMRRYTTLWILVALSPGGLRRILATEGLDSTLSEPYRSMGLGGDRFVMSDHYDG